MRLPSASKLDLFAPCDGPWFLDMPTDLPPTGAAAERGKTIHAHLEKGTTPTGEGRTDVLRARLAEADLPPWIPIDGIACRELVFKWKPATGEALLVGPQSEHPRESWTDRGLFMYGIADHVGRSDKHLLVSDLKTGAVEWLTMPWDGWQTKWLTAVAHKALKWEGNAYACIVSSEAERAWCQERRSSPEEAVRCAQGDRPSDGQVSVLSQHAALSRLPPSLFSGGRSWLSLALKRPLQPSRGGS